MTILFSPLAEDKNNLIPKINGNIDEVQELVSLVISLMCYLFNVAQCTMMLSSLNKLVLRLET